MNKSGIQHSIKNKSPCTLLLFTMVLSQVKEVEHVRMPWLQVNSKSSWPLVASLIHIPSGVVEHPEHWHQAIAVPIGTSNICSSSSDTVNVETDTTSRLGDQGTLLQGVVDTLNAVTVHSEEEAAAQLWPRGSRVEQSGGGVGEQFLR